MLRILGIGDNMCDKNLTTGIMYPGGQSVNIPANAKLLGEDSAFMGCFGNDGVADHLKRTLTELGVDISHARTYPVPNVCAYYKVIDDDRVFIDPPVKINPMTNVLFNMLEYEGFTESDLEYIRSFDIVHCSNDSRLEGTYPEFKAMGVRLSFDFSVYYDKPGYMEQICPNAYFVLLSCSGRTEEESHALLEKAYSLGSKICIGTMGGKGSLCYDGTRFYEQQPHWLDSVVDTMGAGDAFIAAFLVDFMRGGGCDEGDRSDVIRHAMSFAADYAAESCLKNGSFGYGKPFTLGDGK